MERLPVLLSIALGAILVNNFILSQFLGICPFLGVSKKVDTALGMGLAVIFVMGVASAVTWLINEFLLTATGPGLSCRPWPSSWSSPPWCSSWRCSCRRCVPSLYEALGVYLPLITTNCAVLGVVLQNVAECLQLRREPWSTASPAAWASCWPSSCFASVRERTGVQQVPQGLRWASPSPWWPPA